MKKIIIVFFALFPLYGVCDGVDPNIVFQIKPVDTIKMLSDGDRLSRAMQSGAVESEKTRIYRDANGDPQGMLDLAKKSKLARFVVPYFQEYAYQQQQYELNMLKLQAEIEKSK